MIGRTFQRTRRVVVLLIAEDGQQQGFEVADGTVEWTWTGVVNDSSIGGGSKAKLTVEGRFHRQDRPGEYELPAPTPTPEITS